MNTTIFLSLCKSEGLTTPTPEFKYHEKRRWRIDYAFVEHKIALEVEGGVWSNGRHTRGSGFVKDMEKYNALAVNGWRLLRVVPGDLCKLQTIEMIKFCINNS